MGHNNQSRNLSYIRRMKQTDNVCVFFGVEYVVKVKSLQKHSAI